jgi:hypothetical protein
VKQVLFDGIGLCHLKITVLMHMVKSQLEISTVLAVARMLVQMVQ